MAALLALVMVALVVISFVSLTQLRGILINRADQQLQTASNQIINHGLSEGQRNPGGLQFLNTVYVQFYTQSGVFVGNVTAAGSIIETTPSIGFSVTAASLAADVNRYVTLSAQSGGTWRAYIVSVATNAGTTGYVITATDLSDVYSTITKLTWVDVIVSTAILFVLAVVGFVVVQANLAPLVEIEETAEEIAAGHLDRRVPERDPRTEVGSLGRSLNTMLGHIEEAFRVREESEAAAHQSEVRMRRFIADASHELRTPLTAIRGFAEYYRQRGGISDNGGLTPDDLERIMQRVEAEAARMGLLVEDLLLLARLDQQRPLQHRPVDLLTLAADAVHDARLIAPDRPIDLKVQPGAAFLVIGDEPRLRQVIGNLMSNALTHTPDGTEITVSIGSGRLPTGDPAVFLDVKDNGAGMSPEQSQRVFERFYRADAARNRATGGTGLGLAIVAALVAAHGGTTNVMTAPGAGATFRVALPLDPEALGAEEDIENERMALGPQPASAARAAASAPSR
jgi:signal transduction histidine kinase